MQKDQANEKDARDLLKFPFLGSFEDGEPFQYLFISMIDNDAEIALLPWFLNRVQLRLNDKIYLHLPSLLSLTETSESDLLGTVVSEKIDHETGGKIVRVFFQNKLKFSPGIISSETPYEKYLSSLSPAELLIHFLEDCGLLKSGVKIYLKHLIPYFSRISDFSKKEYASIETYFLRDVEIHVINNEYKLGKIYQEAKEKIKHLHEIPAYIDLEVLREAIESEISSAVFNIIFSNAENIHNWSLINPQYGIYMYIHAIKTLEKRLYTNYNNIVQLYLQALSST